MGRVQTAVQGLLALVLVCLGIGVSVSGMLAFRAARTTVDPRNPGKATQLVAGGIYRLSRNPMYVGLLCTITAWAIYLGSPWGCLLYTSDAADERSSVDLGGRRIIKKKKGRT